MYVEVGMKNSLLNLIPRAGDGRLTAVAPGDRVLARWGYGGGSRGEALAVVKRIGKSGRTVDVTLLEASGLVSYGIRSTGGWPEGYVIKALPLDYRDPWNGVYPEATARSIAR